MLHFRNRILPTIAASSILAGAAVAMGAPGELRSFGPAGHGDGKLGPHAAAVAVADDGDIFVPDDEAGRIEVFTNAGTPLATWGDLDEPSALALDGDRVLVGDADGVHAFTRDGVHQGDLGGPESAGGIAVGPDGKVYVTDTAGAHVETLDGDTIGSGLLAEPVGLAVAADGTVFVADRGENAVKRFDAGGELVDAWPAVDPHGVAIAADGTLYVAETDENRVGHFTEDGVRIDDLGADALNVPRGVAIDCRGTVYVVDNSNPRGHVFAEPGTLAPPCPPPDDPPPAGGTGDPPPNDPPPNDPPPVQGNADEEPEVGQTARATVLHGTVYVGRGASRRELTGQAMLPMGQQVDTTEGAVRLEFEAVGADRAVYGPLMEAEFDSGPFTIHQAEDDSLVEIALLGVADTTPRAGKARASARKPRRRVWTRARGRFRTRGNHGAATVRGTRWLTEERPRGTFFQVTEGSVAVKRFSGGRTRLLRAPGTYLAEAPCVSRRRFKIRLRPPAGTVVRGVKVRLDGRRIPVRRGKRLTAVIDLRGRPKGRVVVRIAVRTAEGRVLRGIRDYHPCRRGRARSEVPDL